MRSRILLICSLVTTFWTPVHGGCEISHRHDGCQYTVHCIGTAGTMYTSGCDEDPNVTFVMESANTRNINLGFFSRTNFDQRVRQFKAINNNWDVIEPNTFKYYRKTISMDLHQNRITDIKDGAFNELVMLQHLNLSDNMIYKLQDKSLQISVVTQNLLEVLDLSNNFLSSLGSDIFTNLANLKTLLLHDNLISIMESNCFSTLRHLTHLTLYENRITSLNLTLAAMSELKHLDMSENLIGNLTAFDMIRLMSLEHLNMSHNCIESVSVNCFAQAFNLHTLDLSYNWIASPIEKEMFNYNSNLTYLNLFQNKITTLGDSVFKSSKLNYVNIEKNNITGDITNNTFIGLENITSIIITNQHIEALRNNAFSAMIHLQRLNLSHNNINIVETASFINASALIMLDLSYNFVTDVEFFRLFASNLTDIAINNNNITVIPKHIFSNHSSLKVLDLSGNVIVTIEPNSLSLYNIQYLYLRNNNISGTLMREVFSPARWLKELDLSYHNLKAIDESALIDSPMLKTLNFSHNNIQYIDSNNFKGVDNLSSLDISSNNLTDLKIDGKLGQLTELILRDNSFACIPNIIEFVNGSNFSHLDISYNKIYNVTYPGFAKLTNMTDLNLSHNNLSYVNNEFTNRLTTLIQINLESNHIKEINLTYFKKVRNVNLMSNDIAYINDSQLKNLYDLRTLNLRFNKLKEISPGTFQHLSLLRSLILSDNNITSLRFGSFRGLSSTHSIDLSKNRLTTINVDIFHECYELRTLIIDYNNITSVDVERLVEVSPNLELISLGGNPIACAEIVRSTSNKKPSYRNVEITSIHKIFHEDNVHGIKCGETGRNISVEVTTEVITKQTTAKSESAEGISWLAAVMVWCLVISVLLILGLGFMYWHYWRNRNLTTNSDARMQFQNTSSRNSEIYSDLLS